MILKVRRIAVVGTRVPGASRRLDPGAGIGHDLRLGRASSQEIAIDVVGCSTS